MNRSSVAWLPAALLLLSSSAALAQSSQSMNGPNRDRQVRALSVSTAGGTTRLWIADDDRVKVSTNGGATWSPTTAPFLDPYLVHAHPTGQGYLHAATNGILRRSTNSGASWPNAVTQDGAIPLAISVSAVNSDRWFFGTDTVKQGASWITSLYRTTNNGGIWNPVQDFRTIRTYVNDVLAGPTSQFQDYVLVAGTNQNAAEAAETESINEIEGLSRGVWLSVNGGGDSSWTSFAGGIVPADKNITALCASVTGDSVLVLAACGKSSGVRLYKSFNFGGWESGCQFSSSGPRHLRAMRTSPTDYQRIAAATEKGCYVSSDRGQSWYERNDPAWTDLDARTVTFDPSDGTLYLGMFSSTYRSTNLGGSWTKISSGTVAVSVSGMGVRGGNMIAVSGEYPAIFSSSGSTWQEPLFPSAQAFTGSGAGLHPSGLSYGYACGQKDGRAAVYSRNPTDSSWALFDGVSANGYFAGVATDPKAGSGRVYVFGSNKNNDGRNLYWSTNDGQGWSDTRGADVGGSFDTSTVLSLLVDSSGSATPSRTLYAGLYGGGAWKSTDSGSTWSSLAGLGSLTVNAIDAEFSGTDTVYFGTSTGVYRSTNGGSSSTQLTTSGFTGALRLVVRRVHRTGPNQIWLITQNGQDIYWSSDGGTTWVSFSTSGWSKPLTDMKLDMTANAYVYVGTNAGIRRIDPVPATVTGVQSAASGGHPGISWAAHPESDVTKYKVYRYYRYCVYYFPNKQCGSAQGDTCLTPNGITATSYVDTQWDIICPGCVGSNLRIAGYYVKAMDAGSQESPPSASVEFTVGGDDQQQLKAVAEGSPERFSLSSNYPNPFNPRTTIRYDLPEDAHVRLAVLDLLGREVAVVVNERQETGRRSVSVDATALSSGVYFYRLTAGSFTAVRRMMVLK